MGRVRAGHLGDVGADDGGEFVFPERQAKAHQAIVDAPSHDVIPDGKGDARRPCLCPGATAPEEGVAGTHLLQLVMFGEPGLAECSDLCLVARQFSSQ
ncbi:hypothetical protein SprV_0100483700 [Sparganum proliferum]